MITFIESGNRIATENFETGEIYTITYTIGNYRTMCCIGIGTDFVMFQGTSPNALFCLTLGTAETVSTIELGGGGSGTMNYNDLSNKPQINGIVLIGNKTASDLNLVSQNDLDNYVTDTELSTELADYATNATVVAGLATKQDTLSSSQLAAVNSGITSADVAQITTNENNISSFHKATGTEIFFSETEPTGAISAGSYWISKTATKRYEIYTKFEDIEQGAWGAQSLDKTTSTIRCRIGDEIMVKAGTEYTITISNAPVDTNRMGINYRNSLGGSVLDSGWVSAKNGDTTISIPDNCVGITVVFSKGDNTVCQPSDFGDFAINGIAWH